MDVAQAIRLRYSVRSFQDREVEDDKLEKLLEAARLAPSASNRQEWRFVVVRDPQKRTQLAEASCQSFVAEAPIVLICCAQSDGHVMACGELCYPIDVAIAMEHIALMATELGLGTCWIGAFDAQKAKEIAGIPPNIRVVELMLLGYPADKPKPKDRLFLDEIVRYEHW